MSTNKQRRLNEAEDKLDQTEIVPHENGTFIDTVLLDGARRTNEQSDFERKERHSRRGEILLVI